MILITGATGHFGQALLIFLLEKGINPAHLIALVRGKEKENLFTGKGIQVRYGDYNDTESLVNAFRGVDKLMFISANDIANRGRQHENVVEAAKRAGVKHIVYTSSERKTDTEENPLGMVGIQHFHTEKKIKESGMTYTLMRNNLYMDLIPLFIGKEVLEKGIYFPAGEGRLAWALRKEMAEAAAVILAGEGHENKEYSIAGTTNYSFADIATTLSRLSGKQVNYISPETDDFVAALIQAGIPEEGARSVASFGSAIQAGEFYVEHPDLEKLIGHPATTLEEFLKTAYSL